jgi:hypothetical protein
VPSTATIAAPPPGTLRCNIVDANAGDESAARSLSTDSAASAAGGPLDAADVVDFQLDL